MPPVCSIFCCTLHHNACVHSEVACLITTLLASLCVDESLTIVVQVLPSSSTKKIPGSRSRQDRPGLATKSDDNIHIHKRLSHIYTHAHTHNCRLHALIYVSYLLCTDWSRAQSIEYWACVRLAWDQVCGSLTLQTIFQVRSVT